MTKLGKTFAAFFIAIFAVAASAAAVTGVSAVAAPSVAYAQEAVEQTPAERRVGAPDWFRMRAGGGALRASFLDSGLRNFTPAFFFCG